ncbi:nucleotidyltransferase [Rhizobium bangladeshense]|uniref:nucleotidyltransferase domain-containing protein n=1 Tax=Rhizobium bangladeshense TaxID=1138189 RepID=UPI001A99141D|nr:nucleotidyltransferase [Rhizobium bangladeshense]QSY96047.1 nucleotidyltransferase [Rhizobium bangladeshense]
MNVHVNTVEAFLEALVAELEIPDSRYEQAERSFKSFGAWLHRPESTLRHLDPVVYCQGSFRLGTAIRPHTEAEEYDVDSVCELRLLSKSQCSQADLKRWLGIEVQAYHDAQNMTKPVREGNRCWILDYADGAQFHMDIVAAVPNTEQQRRILEERRLSAYWASTAISITDRRVQNYRVVTNDWPRSNPKGYSTWFASRQAAVFERRRRAIVESLKRQGVTASVEEMPDFKVKTPLQAAIMILKRHRDNMFARDTDVRPISVIITTLAAHAYENQDTISGALFTILDRMDQFIVFDGQKYVIANPTDALENFADKWEKEPKKADAFFAWLRQARADFTAAARAASFREMADALNPRMGYALSTRALDKLTGGSRLLRAATGATAGVGATGAPTFANAARQPNKPQGYA